MGGYAITAAGGCQYLAVKMADNTEAVSTLRPASGTKMIFQVFNHSFMGHLHGWSCTMLKCQHNLKLGVL
jgi:hypothetical protein